MKLSDPRPLAKYFVFLFLVRFNARLISKYRYNNTDVKLGCELLFSFLNYVNADLNLELSAHALSLLSLGSGGKSLRMQIRVARKETAQYSSYKEEKTVGLKRGSKK